MKILNRDIGIDHKIEKWMNCPHKKIVINRGSGGPTLTEEGLKRYAAIKGIPAELLITQLNMWQMFVCRDYIVHHSEVQCDPDFITLVKNNPREIIFGHIYYDPVIIDLSKCKATKFIVVSEPFGYEGNCKETLYEYKFYKKTKAKLDALYAKLYKLKLFSRLKEVR